MPQQQGPRFNYFQAPQGPDASRQYGDWQDAIMAQGEALNRPLTMLLQGLIESRLQTQRLNYAKRENEDHLAYRAGRDKIADEHFDKEHALRQSSESRQSQGDAMEMARGGADVDLLMQILAPQVPQKPSPLYEHLQGVRGQMGVSPVMGATPHASVMDDAFRMVGQQQDREAKEQALQQRNAFVQSYVQNEVKAKNLDEADLPAVMARLQAGDEDGALKMVEDGRKRSKGTSDRTKQLKEMEAYIKAHPDDPEAAKYADALPSLKAAVGNPELFDPLYKDGAARLFKLPTEKSGTSKGATIDFPDIGKVEVPPYVAKGGVVEGGLPQDVRAWIHDTAFGLAQKDKRFFGTGEGSMHVAATPEQRVAILTEKEDAVSRRVQDQFGWTVQALPFGAEGEDTAPAGSGEQAPQPQREAQPKQSRTALEDLTPDQMSEAHALLKAGDKGKLREYLIQSRRKNQTELVGMDESVVNTEWLKENPEPKAWWDTNSAYSSVLKKHGFKSAAAARAAWEKAKNEGPWGGKVPWSGEIRP